MDTPSTKPYLIRALYEWCADNGFTPYISVWVNEHTQVPRPYVADETITLNIGARACAKLQIDNDWISFNARFGGMEHEVWIPIGHVMMIFAKENQEGLCFDVEPWEPAAAPLHVVKSEGLPSAAPASGRSVEAEAKKAKTSHLKIVK